MHQPVHLVVKAGEARGGCLAWLNRYFSVSYFYNLERGFNLAEKDQ
jgi:hypothetical protein